MSIQDKQGNGGKKVDHSPGTSRTSSSNQVISDKNPEQQTDQVPISQKPRDGINTTAPVDRSYEGSNNVNSEQNKDRSTMFRVDRDFVGHRDQTAKSYKVRVNTLTDNGKVRRSSTSSQKSQVSSSGGSSPTERHGQKQKVRSPLESGMSSPVQKEGRQWELSPSGSQRDHTALYAFPKQRDGTRKQTVESRDKSSRKPTEESRDTSSRRPTEESRDKPSASQKPKSKEDSESEEGSAEVLYPSTNRSKYSRESEDTLKLMESDELLQEALLMEAARVFVEAQKINEPRRPREITWILNESFPWRQQQPSHLPSTPPQTELKRMNWNVKPSDQLDDARKELNRKTGLEAKLSSSTSSVDSYHSGHTTPGRITAESTSDTRQELRLDANTLIAARTGKQPLSTSTEDLQSHQSGSPLTSSSAATSSRSRESGQPLAGSSSSPVITASSQRSQDSTRRATISDDGRRQYYPGILLPPSVTPASRSISGGSVGSTSSDVKRGKDAGKDSTDPKLNVSSSQASTSTPK